VKKFVKARPYVNSSVLCSSNITSGHPCHRDRLDQENHGWPQWRSKSPRANRSCPGPFLWPAPRPAVPPAAARVDLCETVGEFRAASADIVSPRLTAHTARSCVLEASSVDVACQEVPAVAAFSPQEKKKDVHMSSTSLLRTKAVRGAITPIKGRENVGAGCSPAFAKDIVLLFLLALCKSWMRGVKKWIAVGFLVTALSWPALYEVRHDKPDWE
jgi:hypothetical protein